MRLENQLASILKTKTLHHFSITTVGTVINGFLGLLFYIVVARSLGPQTFGILAVAITTMSLLSDITDFGIDTAVLRFISRYRNLDRTKSLRFLKLGFEIKAMVWLIILLLGWFVMPKVAEIIFFKPELTNALRFALVGVGGALIFSLVSHTLQAFEKFWWWSLLNIGLNGLRLVVILTLILLGGINLNTALTVYIIMPFVGFLGCLFLLPNFVKVKNERSVAGELLNYSKWVAIVGVMAATTSRLDTFISTRFLSVANVGIYAAAVQLSSVVPQLVFALATVVAPKLASFDSDKKAIAYLKKLQLLVGGIFVMGTLLLPLSFVIIPLFYGPAYQEGVIPLMVLLFAQLIFLLALPAHQAIYYYFSKPSIFSFLATVQLIVVAAGGWFLISNFGIVGASFTILVNNLLGFFIPLGWVVYKFKKGGNYKKEDYLGTHIS